MCECTEWICKEAFINPCSEGVEVDIVADYTGNMTGRVLFNGAWVTFEIGVTDGERIILPTEHLNENYSHELRLYNSGVLIECYRIKTFIDNESPTYTPMPATVTETFVKIFKMGTVSGLNSIYGTPVSISDGSTIQDDALIGATIIDVENVTENLMPVTGFGVDSFNSTTGTITLSQSYSNTFFKVTYKR